MKNLSLVKFNFRLLLFIALASCNNPGANKGAVYQPLFSSDSLQKNTLIFGFPSFSYSENADPLIRYLNKNLPGVHIKIKACSTWDEYISYLNQNKFDITLINGILAPEIENQGYSILGKISNDEQYNSVVFIRKDAGITKVGDLRGKTIALTPSKVVPGTMMPIYYLYQKGINVNHDMQVTIVSSFESAIISAYLGKSEAGACLKRNWNVYVKAHPEVLAKVEVKWETPPLINNALLVKNSIGSSVVAKLLSALFSMQKSPEGRAALEKLDIDGFEKANKDTYKPMMDFKQKYDSVIQ